MKSNMNFRWFVIVTMLISCAYDCADKADLEEKDLRQNKSVIGQRGFLTLVNGTNTDY
ncbi:MAG: hypothetical protein J7L96_00455 [Bacteroidales bacterium]|nr:hypothetical protein [Bacteroidales bacterium]